MSAKVVQTFYGCHMGVSFRGMKGMLGRDLAAGEAAVFVNVAWTAAKVLYPNGHIHYHRVPSGCLTVADVVALPTRLPGSKLAFGAGMAGVMKEYGRFLRETRDGDEKKRRSA